VRLESARPEQSSTASVSPTACAARSPRWPIDARQPVQPLDKPAAKATRRDVERWRLVVDKELYELAADPGRRWT